MIFSSDCSGASAIRHLFLPFGVLDFLEMIAKYTLKWRHHQLYIFQYDSSMNILMTQIA